VTEAVSLKTRSREAERDPDRLVRIPRPNTSFHPSANTAQKGIVPPLRAVRESTREYTYDLAVALALRDHGAIRMPSQE